jgi:sensor histidine kinase YesM
MRKLKNWTARRAGGRITIKAQDAATGEEVKITNVDTIDGPSEPGEATIATDKDGERYNLA